MDTSMQDKIVERLRRQGQGKVFTPKDFLDLGSRESVDQALSRLAKAETVQRLGRGLYCYPKINKRLGIIISPDVDEIASALARQTGSRIAPSGAMAANRLGPRAAHTSSLNHTPTRSWGCSLDASNHNSI